LELPYDGRIVGLTYFVRGSVIDEDGGSSVGSDDVYRGRVEPVLVSLSDSYSEKKILVCDSRSSSCPAYMFY